MSDKITVEGYKVGYMIREVRLPTQPDSDWQFIAGNEDEDYMNNSKNYTIFALNTICNYDLDIISYLYAEIGSSFIRVDSKLFEKMMVENRFSLKSKKDKSKILGGIKISLLKNITDLDEDFLSGTLFVPMFGKEINVWIEKEADLQYAEQWAESLVELDDIAIDNICQRISDYHHYMLEEWNEEFVEEINEKVPSDVSGRDILNYIENPIVHIMGPLGEGVGYSVSGYCEWEPEHGVEFIIRDGDLLYVGEEYCLGAWASDDEYEVDF